jgi:threonine synthase
MQSESYVNEPVITLATAHPAKFPDAFKNIEIGEIKIPKTLQNINNSNENFTIINNNIEEIKNFISSKI